MYARAMPTVHWLRVARTCNNACTVCSESATLDGAQVPLEDLLRAIDAVPGPSTSRPGEVEVRLSGGEPTLSPHLPQLIERVASRGVSPVLVTNGRALAKPGRLAQLVARGLAGVRVSLHGATAATHDARVGVAGAFRQTVTALAQATTTQTRRTLCFVVTRDSAPELPALFALAKRLSCDQVELRDVLPTDDRGICAAARLSDEEARAVLTDADREATRCGIHLRVIGFERAATNRRATVFGPAATWPMAPAATRTPSPGRVVVFGLPADPVMNRSTVRRVIEEIERRGVPAVHVPPAGTLDLRHDDLVLCTGYEELRDLYARAPCASDIDVRVMDFHMLGMFDAFRAAWVPDGNARAKGPWWPSDRLEVISCFPGYAALYDWYGVPRGAVRVHPYVVDPQDFGRGDEPDASYVFSGGNHLRDLETLVEASAARRSASSDIHVFHGGTAPPPSAGIVYRGTVEFMAFYRALAASRFVVLPLSRDPTCAAGITVAAMALAAGRAVVASATPAMRDHLDDGENALLVEPEDPRALAAAIDRLDQDDALRCRLEAGARRAATTATAATFVDVLLGARLARGDAPSS